MSLRLDPASVEVVRRAARAHEYDRYIASLLAPRAVRADLMALAAFAGEIARIPVFVSDPMIGEIRLQWWRDVLAGDALARTGHPIADAIADAVHRHRLDRERLHGVIDAQSACFTDQPFAAMADLHDHLDRTDGALFALAAAILGGDPAAAPITADDTLRRATAARAYGLARIAAELAPVAAQGRSLLPAELLDRAGVRFADLTRGAVPPLPSRALADALLAAIEAEMARPEHNTPWASAGIARAALPAATVRSYLRALRSVGPRLLTEPVEVAPLARAWAVLRASARGTGSRLGRTR